MPPLHTTTSRSTRYSTSHSHSLAPFTSTTSTRHPHSDIAAHFTPHHIPHHITPQLHLDFTSHHHHIWYHWHCICFHIWHSRNSHTAHCIWRILHHNSISPHFASCITQHSTTRRIPHHTDFAAFQSHHVSVVTFHISRTTFHIHHNSNRSTTSLHNIPHHAHIPPRITSCTSHSNINCTSHHPTRGAGIAQWLEHRTRDWKVAGTNPCWNGGRIFFSRVDFLCWLLFRYPFHPRVTTVARKKSRSFCQKCRWQVTAKHAYTLCMWILLNRASALVTTCP